MADRKMINRVVRILRSSGMAGLVFIISSRFGGLLAARSRSFDGYKYLFAGRKGMEIGGPSRAFTARGIFPVYPIVDSIDNCTFGNATVWEGDIKEGQTFKFDESKPAGLQHIAEATDMASIPSATYDFVLASHVLEHVANPVLALCEWKRLLKDQGMLVLLLPDKYRTFDHRRPVTTLEHLIADFERGVGEGDMTHLPEILAMHDLTRDPEAGDAAAFKSRSMRNLYNRCLHHHVFDAALAVSLVEHVGLKVLAVEELRPFHILIVAEQTTQSR